MDIMVDTLGKRYGWTMNEIRNGMYFEEVYEQYEFASNMEAMERHSDMQFHFNINVQSKKAKFPPLTIPYPKRGWEAPKKAAPSESLPTKLRRSVIKAKMDDAQRQRFEEVKAKMAEHKKKIAELKAAGKL